MMRTAATLQGLPRTPSNLLGVQYRSHQGREENSRAKGAKATETDPQEGPGENHPNSLFY